MSATSSSPLAIEEYIAASHTASVCAACRVTRLLELCNGDATLMMSWFGVAQSINNLLSVFISPVVGSLSDAGGRPVNPMRPVRLRSC